MKTTKQAIKPSHVIKALVLTTVFATSFMAFIKMISVKKYDGAEAFTPIKVTEIKETTTLSAATSTPANAKPLKLTRPVPKTEPGVTYKNLGEFTLTAYCPCVECCGEWSKYHPSRIGTDYIQKTITGTIPEEGRTIGVDPDVIPYGSVVVIDGHEYIAEDTGSLIEGNHIDVYFKNHEDAIKFGAQSENVFLKIRK